jgi:hypothetical protein
MNSNPAMRFKPALTNDELTALQGRSADLPDARSLLWEVAWRCALALWMHGNFWQDSSSTALILADSLRARLGDESVMQEQSRLKDRIPALFNAAPFNRIKHL